MLFNSLAFLVFAALFFALWPLFKSGPNRRWAYLTACSFFFYGWWDWRFLFVLLASGTLDFSLALAMRKWPRRAKLLLSLSILGNVGILSAFKYSGFFAANLDRLLALLGLGLRLRPHVPDLLLLLPVGISFFTFQSMSYTIDVYRGRLEPTRNPLHFFAYLSLFPQLVAGPIVRAQALLPQLAGQPRTDERMRWDGLKLIAVGYFLKVVLADNLAPAVDQAFAGPAGAGGCAYWWLAALMFAFQIYCDFAGYTSIARGLARWMGFDIGVNFDHPYGAAGLREFWQRWHISLSSWFRDYVYIPLGGNRRGTGRGYLNLWITMLLSGLWHGAAWTFVLWGALHAALLSLERATDWTGRLARLPLGRYAAVLLVLVQVTLAWVLFRSQSLDQALQIIGRMFSFTGGLPALSFKALLALAAACCYEGWFVLGLNRRIRLPRGLEPLAYALLLAACVFLRGPAQAFVYFQF